MRSVQRQYEPRYGQRAIELDLEAFSPTIETVEPGNYRNPAFLAKPQAVRSATAARGKREAEQAGSRAAQARAARSKAQLQKQAKAVGAKQATAGKTEHLHAERSPQARKERLPATCKERPPTAKKKGGGASRAFVPWCSRR